MSLTSTYLCLTYVAQGRLTGEGDACISPSAPDTIISVRSGSKLLIVLSGVTEDRDHDAAAVHPEAVLCARTGAVCVSQRRL